MSLGQFQAALARVIRVNSGCHREHLDDLLPNYDLTDQERMLLADLSGNRRVQAYQKDMFEARWKVICRAIGGLFSIVPESLFRKLWSENFDPTHTALPYVNLATGFLEYLTLDQYARKILNENSPSYIVEALRYLHAVYFFSGGGPWLIEDPPPNSCLCHKRFRVLRLNHDVRGFCHDILGRNSAQLSADMILDTAPEAEPAPSEGGQGQIPAETRAEPCEKAMYLLFLASGVSGEFRTFEIDEGLYVFLETQSSGVPSSIPRPSCYPALVSMGLCREI